MNSSMSEQVKLAEQYLNKTLIGTIGNKPFVPDTIRICNKYARPLFLTDEEKGFITKGGWIVILENIENYTNVLNIKEVITFRLNSQYTATIEGNEVRIGCQTFSKDIIIQFAELLKTQ
jgi:hypothetical protein